MRYLHGTTDTCLVFERSKNDMIGYVNSDIAGDLDRRRSLSCYVFFICRCTINWKALQSIMALSITEAKYIDIIEVAKKALWLKGLALEMRFLQDAIRMHYES